MATAPDEIRLTPEQQSQIAQVADSAGQPWEVVLNEALTTYSKTLRGVATTETVYDKMVRLGLLGCVEDAPADLRTNPEYMEGYGENGA
jgi:hypothetical protein